MASGRFFNPDSTRAVPVRIAVAPAMTLPRSNLTLLSTVGSKPSATEEIPAVTLSTFAELLPVAAVNTLSPAAMRAEREGVVSAMIGSCSILVSVGW